MLEESTDQSLGDIAFMSLTGDIITDAHSGDKYTPDEYQQVVADHPECVFLLMGDVNRPAAEEEEEIEFTIDDINASNAERKQAKAAGIDYNPENSPNPRVRALAQVPAPGDPALSPDLEEMYLRMGREDLVEYYRKESLRYQALVNGSTWERYDSEEE